MPLTKISSPAIAVILSALTVLAAATGGLSHVALADTATIEVQKPWSRATPGGATIGAAYMELKLMSGDNDRLIDARTERAGRVEIHTHINEDGVMKMRRIDGLDLEAGGVVKLAPGGHHLMLFDLKAPLKEGESVPLTLVFEQAGEIAVEAKVAPIGAMSPDGASSAPRGSSHDHHGH